MEIQTKVSLKEHSTLHIGGAADYFVAVRNTDELHDAIRFAQEKDLPWHVIGEGSNILFDDTGVRGLVIKNCMDTVLYRESAAGLTIEAGAGLLFDTLVSETVRRGWWGLENLSAIPGTVGATPVQNVGAYGIEIATFITEVVVYDVLHDTTVVLSRDACHFGYRHSLFKEAEGQNLIITAVHFFVPRDVGPTLSYRDLALRFEGRAPQSLTPQDVRDATIAIRAGKFPDWHEVGTAGSFFKNPVVSDAVFTGLRHLYPGIVGHPHEGAVKLSLGWILDHVCALRGVHDGNVGTYEKQALVVVAARGATAKEVIAFAEKVIACVKEKTNITIAWEVTYKK